MSELLPRALEGALHRAWSRASVVVLEGPRHAGKTALARMLVPPERFFRLDDPATMATATASPRAWVESLPVGSAIDEAQLLPGLMLEIKRRVDDAGGGPGQLLLTGSHRLARDELGGTDPLVGRAARLQLLPLSQSELGGDPRDVISAWFDEHPRDWSCSPSMTEDMHARIRRGGFPAIRNIDANTLGDWQRDYAAGMIGSGLSGRDSARLDRLFRWLCGNSGREQNKAKFAQANDMAVRTLDEYLTELSQLLLVAELQPFDLDAAKQVIKRPKVFVIDPVFIGNHTDGPAFETFVACELQRLLTASSTHAKLSWLRCKSFEVDFILEREDGKMIVIEVKSARECGRNDFKNIRACKEAYPDKFAKGFVLHCGDHAQRHDDDMWSLPFSALWSVGASQRLVKVPSSKLGRDALVAATSKLRKQRESDVEHAQRFSERLRNELHAQLAGVAILQDRKFEDPTTVYEGTLRSMRGEFWANIAIYRGIYGWLSSWSPFDPAYPDEFPDDPDVTQHPKAQTDDELIDRLLGWLANYITHHLR
jgi:uncharacterized protein